MGVPPEEAIGSVRLTLGCSTIEEAIERAADALSAAWTALTGISKSGGDSQRVAS